MKDCVSLEIAKKLKGAGWPRQDSLYAYCSEPDCPETTPIARPQDRYCESCGLAATQDIEAPSVGELLEALPSYCHISKGITKYHAWNDTNGIPKTVTDSLDNPADALALLWMALKEKGIV